MTGIKFITDPDETGLGRIVVDGKFYGLPSGAVAALARSFTAHAIAVSDEIERNREAIAELCAAIQLASDMVSDWGAYASPYLQNKHDLKGDIAQLQSIISKHSTTTEKRK